MKLFPKKLFGTVIIIIIIAVIAVAAYFISKSGLGWLRPSPLVEQIPREEIIEIKGFEDAEFYDSTNEFIGAEIRINVSFDSHFLPAEKMPSEYKEGQKKVSSSAVILVKDIASLEILEKMREALASSSYLKLRKESEIQAVFGEAKIDGKKAKIIKELNLKADDYYFVRF